MSKKGEKGWQFPDNNCTNNYGLEDAGTETFAGDSDGGLAREICQMLNRNFSTLPNRKLY